MILLSILVCLAAFVALLSLLRKDRLSLGLPVAYMVQLLLIHVPGAVAHVVAGDLFAESDLTATGIRFTAIGSVCYVCGVWFARATRCKISAFNVADRRRFSLFCLLGGWCVTYGLGLLRNLPSLGALVEQGGFVWMLGVILGLRTALVARKFNLVAIWLSALAVYPLLMLLIGGFLSWGSMAAIIVLSALAVSTRYYRWVAVGFAVGAYLGLSVFVTYFQHRNEIRSQVWAGDTSLQTRVATVADAFSQFELFDPSNARHLRALDQRLNQNYFVGLAADRLDRGEVDYLQGATIWDGVLGLVPRALWPEKPVTAGSGRIVASMTGLNLPEGVSFGVGNVMEFQVNFGMPGLIVGFILLGWVTAKLDRNGAVAEKQGDLGRLIVCFLPAVALMSPIGSLVDLSSAYAAGLIAALGWREAWNLCSKKSESYVGVHGGHSCSPV